MVDCNKCGRKIKLLEKKYQEYKKDKKIIFCKKCFFKKQEEAGNVLYRGDWINKKKLLEQKIYTKLFMMRYPIKVHPKTTTHPEDYDKMFCNLNREVYNKYISEGEEPDKDVLITDTKQGDKNNYFRKKYEKVADVEVKQKTVKIEFNNYKVSYEVDGRLTTENMLIKKRQAFNSEIFFILNCLFSKKETIFNFIIPNFELDDKIFDYDTLIIDFFGIGLDSKGNDKKTKIARIKINLKKWEKLNLKNIFEKNRWDLLVSNLEFDFNKFPDGVDGYKGEYGEIYEAEEDESLNIDEIFQNFLDELEELKLDAVNSGDHVEFLNFLVYEGINTCEVMLGKASLLEARGMDSKTLIKSLKEVLQNSIINSLHLSLIQSLKSTLSNPSNKKMLHNPKKLTELNKLLDTFITENKNSTKDYETLKKKIKKFDETEKGIKFSLLLERIEKEIDYKEKIQKINEFYKKICKKEKNL